MSVREFVEMLFNRYTYYNGYRAVVDWFFPKQRWLTRKIPNHWCDKVELIPRVLFASIIHFVEKEDGLEMLRLQIRELAQDAAIVPDFADRMAECQNVIEVVEAAYSWAKQRDAFEEETWDNIPDEPLLASLNYYRNREEYGIDKDIKHMTDIVRVHRYLWT